MPFYIEARNTKTGEVSTKDANHAHAVNGVIPPEFENHPGGHAHIHSLADAKKRAIVYANSLNAKDGTTDWVPVYPPEYYPDPRHPSHGKSEHIPHGQTEANPQPNTPAAGETVNFSN